MHTETLREAQSRIAQHLAAVATAREASSSASSAADFPRKMLLGAGGGPSGVCADALAAGQKAEASFVRLQRAREELTRGFGELEESRKAHEAMRNSVGAELTQIADDLRSAIGFSNVAGGGVRNSTSGSSSRASSARGAGLRLRPSLGTTPRARRRERSAGLGGPSRRSGTPCSGRSHSPGPTSPAVSCSPAPASASPSSRRFPYPMAGLLQA
mmetsp:Transcript_134212/g.237522  ORF Transcript_134212/g.237522 Transcript_134212/m.237522 type:complete len:214 (-) Transcript_134212:57-698(-)